MKTVIWDGWELVFPLDNWQGSTWDGGHFASAREPTGPVFIPGKTARMHAGYDFGCRMREPLRAIADGVVTDTGHNSGAGNYVTIRHTTPEGTPLWWRALHIDHGGTKVRRGQKVTAGEVYALAGNTGASAAPHLHAELTTVEPYVHFSADRHVDIEFVFFGTPGRKGYVMVTFWQTELKTLGFYSGRIDGIWGPATEEAMRKFVKASLEGGGGGGGVLLDHRHKNRLTHKHRDDGSVTAATRKGGWIDTVGGPFSTEPGE